MPYRISESASPDRSISLTLHERLFRVAFSDPEVAISELKVMLPHELNAVLDIDRLQIEPETLMYSVLRMRFANILYRVPLRDSDSEFIWCLIAHFSQSYFYSAFRCLEYEVRVWSQHLGRQVDESELPVIVPLILSNDPCGWRAPMRFESLYAGPVALREPLDSCLIRQSPLLDDLTLQTEESLARRTESAYARLVLWSLRNHGHTDPSRKDAWRVEFEKLVAEGRLTEAQMLMSYHWGTSSEDDPMVVRAAIEVSEELAEYANTYNAKLRRRGAKEGQVSLLLTLLESKFPSQVTAEVEARVRAATDEEVADWSVRTLSAASLSAVLDSSLA